MVKLSAELHCDFLKHYPYHQTLSYQITLIWTYSRSTSRLPGACDMAGLSVLPFEDAQYSCCKLDSINIRITKRGSEQFCGLRELQ